MQLKQPADEEESQIIGLALSYVGVNKRFSWVYSIRTLITLKMQTYGKSSTTHYLWLLFSKKKILQFKINAFCSIGSW